MRTFSEFCCGVIRTGDSDSAVKHCTERQCLFKLLLLFFNCENDLFSHTGSDGESP